MRLWHEALIPYLPRQQLLGLHREICGMRGNGWGKKHSVVNYVFSHPYGWLFAYHAKIIGEMRRRGYTIQPIWWDIAYRGKNHEPLSESEKEKEWAEFTKVIKPFDFIYPEHNDAYLQECLANLWKKGIEIDFNYYVEPKISLPETTNNGMWLRTVKSEV